MIFLTAPDGKSHPLKPDFALIEKIEAEHGSLYALADDLLEKSLPLSEMIAVVEALYAHAGAAATADFLLLQPCADILIRFLLAVLEPVEKVPPGGNVPDEDFLEEMLKQFPDVKER
jgi:hypothetical protein